jgi:hypothetical protein
MGADCKSVGLRLPRFESWICHRGPQVVTGGVAPHNYGCSMDKAAALHHHRFARRGAAVLILTSAALSGCHAHNAMPAMSASATDAGSGSSNGNADERQLRDLYTHLLSALGRHDTAEQVALTCAEYQGDVQRRADSDPFLQIDFFGPPEQVRQLGLDAATDKLLTALAPASREAVQAVAQAIINGDAAQYKTAIQRVEQEGSSVTVDRIDPIEISGDTATVDGSFTLTAFTNPPKVIEGSNHAIREDGRWKDCTSPTQQHW